MPRSPRLQEQWALLERQEYHRAFEGTFALRRQLRGADLHDAYKLLGMACHRQRQYHQAVLWFRKACQGSDDSADWYDLAASATMQGDVELGAEAFEQVSEGAKPDEIDGSGSDGLAAQAVIGASIQSLEATSVVQVDTTSWNGAYGNTTL